MPSPGVYFPGGKQATQSLKISQTDWGERLVKYTSYETLKTISEGRQSVSMTVQHPRVVSGTAVPKEHIHWQTNLCRFACVDNIRSYDGWFISWRPTWPTSPRHMVPLNSSHFVHFIYISCGLWPTRTKAPTVTPLWHSPVVFLVIMNEQTNTSLQSVFIT